METKEEVLSNMLAEILFTRTKADRENLAKKLMKWIPIIYQIKEIK